MGDLPFTFDVVECESNYIAGRTYLFVISFVNTRTKERHKFMTAVSTPALFFDALDVNSFFDDTRQALDFLKSKYNDYAH